MLNLVIFFLFFLAGTGFMYYYFTCPLATGLETFFPPLFPVFSSLRHWPCL